MVFSSPRRESATLSSLSLDLGRGEYFDAILAVSSDDRRLGKSCWFVV
jgi:hypothetical protein